MIDLNPEVPRSSPDRAWDAEYPAESESVVHSSDLSYAVERMSHAFVPHRMRLRGSPEDFRFDHAQRRLSRTSFNLVTFGTDVEVDVKPFGDFYTVMLVLDGLLATVHGKQEASASAGSLLVFNSTTPTNFRMRGRFRQLTLRIDRRLMNEVFREQLQAPPKKPIEFVHMAGTATGAQHDLACFLVNHWRGLGTGGSVWGSERVAYYTERGLVAAILERLPHNYSVPWNHQAPRDAPASFRRAEQYILENVLSPIALQDIAAAAAVSASSVTYLFRKYAGVSPIRYVTRERLKLARYALSESAGTSVTETAFSCGFSHLSHFAKDYRKAFGELPSSTLQRAQVLRDRSQ
jgi:AraC-like DNA-binding protein